MNIVACIYSLHQKHIISHWSKGAKIWLTSSIVSTYVWRTNCPRRIRWRWGVASYPILCHHKLIVRNWTVKIDIFPFNETSHKFDQDVSASNNLMFLIAWWVGFMYLDPSHYKLVDPRVEIPQSKHRGWLNDRPNCQNLKDLGLLSFWQFTHLVHGLRLAMPPWLFCMYRRPHSHRTVK